MGLTWGLENGPEGVPGGPQTARRPMWLQVRQGLRVGIGCCSGLAMDPLRWIPLLQNTGARSEGSPAAPSSAKARHSSIALDAHRRGLHGTTHGAPSHTSRPGRTDALGLPPQHSVCPGHPQALIDPPHVRCSATPSDCIPMKGQLVHSPKIPAVHSQTPQHSAQCPHTALHCAAYSALIR